MKNIYSFMFAVVAMIAAISCTHELDNIRRVDTSSFNARFDGASTTKTAINGSMSVWKKNDAIWVLNGNSKDKSWKKLYKTLDDNQTSATFKEDNTILLDGEQFFAIYPASAADGATWDGVNDLLGVKLTNKQVATESSYDPTAHIAVAKTTTNSLEFKNAISLLKFKVNRNDVKSVTISCTSGKLAGYCNISATGEVTPWTGAGEWDSWVELKMNSGSFSMNKEYYIAVFPGTLSNGFKVEFSTGGDKFEAKKYTKSITLYRNQVLDLGVLDYIVPATVENVYLKPGKWNVGNSTFFLYLYNKAGDNTTVQMKDSDSDGIFEAKLPTGYVGATLCRMPKSSTSINWDKKENQIENIVLPASGSSSVYYTISDWEAGSWNIKPTTKTIYFKPNDWNKDGAKFVAYSWKDSGTSQFAELKEIANGVFSCEIPSAHTKIIVLRKASNSLDWKDEWNRIGDVDIQNGVKCLVVTGWNSTSYKWETTLYSIIQIK